MRLFWKFYISKYPEEKKKVSLFPQKYYAAELFSTLMIIINVFEYQISVLQWFLKDYVTKIVRSIVVLLLFTKIKTIKMISTKCYKAEIKYKY